MHGSTPGRALPASARGGRRRRDARAARRRSAAPPSTGASLRRASCTVHHQERSPERQPHEPARAAGAGSRACGTGARTRQRRRPCEPGRARRYRGRCVARIAERPPANSQSVVAHQDGRGEWRSTQAGATRGVEAQAGHGARSSLPNLRARRRSATAAGPASSRPTRRWAFSAVTTESSSGMSAMS